MLLLETVLGLTRVWGSFAPKAVRRVSGQKEGEAAKTDISLCTALVMSSGSCRSPRAVPFGNLPRGVQLVSRGFSARLNLSCGSVVWAGTVTLELLTIRAFSALHAESVGRPPNHVEHYSAKTHDGCWRTNRSKQTGFISLMVSDSGFVLNLVPKVPCCSH